MFFLRILLQLSHVDLFEKLFCLPAKCLNNSANLKHILLFDCGTFEQATLLPSPNFAQNIWPFLCKLHNFTLSLFLLTGIFLISPFFLSSLYQYIFFSGPSIAGFFFFFHNTLNIQAHIEFDNISNGQPLR